MRIILNWTGERIGEAPSEGILKDTVDNLGINVDNFTDRQKVQSNRQILPFKWQKLPVLRRI